MITEEQALKLLIEANPVSDLSTLDLSGDLPTTRLAEPDKRSREMTTPRSKQPDTTPVLGRHRLLAGAAAVAITIAAVVLLPTTDTAPVADQPTSPVETAEAFLEAYRGSFDVDGAFAYLAADLETIGFGPLAEERLLARFLEATGNKLVELQCEERSGSPGGAVVRCGYFIHEFFSDEMGLGPYGPNWNEFTIVDGKIVSMDSGFDGAKAFSNQIWEPFATWIGANHPDDREVMYDPYPTRWRITKASISLWEQRLSEYVEVATGRPRAGMGFVGLPPEGATLSTPEKGELVASMWVHIGAGSFGNGWLYLYADGRLIWERLDPDPTGGWLERRLTPEGVELIRSEIIATGLFDPDQPAPAPNSGFPRDVNGGSIQVRNGDRLVYVNRFLLELSEKLAELWSWLPENAWEDTEVKAYVPSRYAVCLQSGGSAAPTSASEHLSELPAAARDLLASARQLHMDALVDVDPAGFAFAEGSTEYCFEIATEEARTLAMSLDDAGVEQRPHAWYDGSEVTFVIPNEQSTDPFNWVTLTLWPMLPHGVPAFTGA